MLFVPSPAREENTLEGPCGSVWEFRTGWVSFQSQKETLDGMVTPPSDQISL